MSGLTSLSEAGRTGLVAESAPVTGSSLREEPRLLRCLLVEDNAFDRKLVARLGRASVPELEITSAVDLATARRTLAESPPFDCILLDGALPDGSGLTLTADLIEDIAQPDQAIVLLTGLGSDQMVADAMRHGVLDYLSKDRLTATKLGHVVLNAWTKAKLHRERARMVRDLERSCKSLASYAVAVSHDLRAPLRSITGFIDLIERNHADLFKDEAGEFLGYVRDGARRMNNMVSGFLTQVRLDGDRSPREAVDLNIVLREIESEISGRLAEANGQLVVTLLPRIDAVPAHMAELFRQLLLNSIQYRSPDRPLEISVSLEAAPRHWRIDVRDNGIGIEAGEQQHIFEIFRLGHAASSGNLGLGLATCRRIVENHGGTLTVSSVPEEGACFSVILPRQSGDSLPVATHGTLELEQNQPIPG